MDRKSQRHTTITSSEVFELSARELMTVDGGRGRPPFVGHHFATPTWKYVSGTPSWAVDAARDAGFEVEQID